MSQSLDLKDLYERYLFTKNFKYRWLALYKDLYYYVIPDRDAFNVLFNYVDDGKPTTLSLWDSTPVIAAYQRANDLHGLLLPKDRVWGQMTMNPHRFEEAQIQAFKPKLDEVNSHIMYYLNRSNLSRVVSDSNLDLCGGTAGLWVESHSDDQPIYFRSIPAVCLFAEYSTDDMQSTGWYQTKLSGRYISENWPKYKGSKISALHELPDELYPVVYGQIALSPDKYYIYCFLEEDYEHPLMEIDRAYPQIIIYRDRVRPGEAEGRGIGIDLLPTIRDLNRIVEYDRKSMAFKALPPMFADSNALFNPHSIAQWAGAILMRDANKKSLPLVPLEMPTMPETLEQIKDLREIILKSFQVDPLGEIQQPVKSATEISIRENRAQRTASTDISRLINELPAQIYSVAAKILGQRRLLSLDRGVSKLNTNKLEFEFQSPLYDLQKQDELTHFITNMQIKQQFFGQDAPMATCDLVAVQNFLTDTVNLKANLFKDQQQLKQIFGSIVKAQQAQMQQQAAPQPTPTTAAIPQNAPQQPQVQI